MQALSASPNSRPLNLVITWVVMIPLAFFALNGNIRLDTYSQNNAVGAIYTSLAATGSQSFLSYAMALIILFCAVLCFTRFTSVLNIAANNKVFAVLSFMAVFSAAWSQFPGQSLMLGVDLAVNVGFALYLVARFDSERQMDLFELLGWGVVVASIIAAVLFPQYGLDRQGQGDDVKGAWIGIFPHKNWCSIMAAFLVSAAFYAKPSSSTQTMLRRVYIALSFFLILMTKSRTGWIVGGGLLVYVIITSHLKRYKARDGLLIGGFLSATMLVLGVAIYQNFAAIMLFIGKDPTLTGRTNIWDSVILSIMKRPLLGYGYRAFWAGLKGESANISLANDWVVPAAHNGFLDLALGLGMVGVGFVIYSLLQACRNALICFRRGPSRAAEWYLCIVYLTLISNIAELTVMVPNYLAWIMYVLACAGLSQEAKRMRSGVADEQKA